MITSQLLPTKLRRRLVRSAAVPSVTTPSKVKVIWACAFLTPAKVASLIERSPSPPVSYAMQILFAALAGVGPITTAARTSAITETLDRNFIREPNLDSYSFARLLHLPRYALYLHLCEEPERGGSHPLRVRGPEHGSVLGIPPLPQQPHL